MPEYAAGLQAQVLLVTLAIGVIAGISFDFIRCLRGIVRFKPVPAALLDILYWLFITILCFIGLLWANWIELRLYVFIGLLTGVVFYYLLLSRYIVRFWYRLLTFLLALARMLCRMLTAAGRVGLFTAKIIVLPVLAAGLIVWRGSRLLGRPLSALFREPAAALSRPYRRRAQQLRPFSRPGVEKNAAQTLKQAGIKLSITK